MLVEDDDFIPQNTRVRGGGSSPNTTMDDLHQAEIDALEKILASEAPPTSSQDVIHGLVPAAQAHADSTPSQTQLFTDPLSVAYWLMCDKSADRGSSGSSSKKRRSLVRLMSAPRESLLGKGKKSVELSSARSTDRLTSAPSSMLMDRWTSAGPQPFQPTAEEAKAWAKEWWTARKDIVHEPELEGQRTYLDREPLLKKLDPQERRRLLRGTSPDLRGSWLLDRADQLRACKDDDARQDAALPRRQELPDEAFLSPQQVRDLPRGHLGTECENLTCCVPPSQEAPLRLVSISQ